MTSNIPAYLPVALGAVEITLEEQVASYSVFPNDGIRVTPRLVRKVSNADGITLWEDPPTVKEVISQDTARTMMELLRAVTAHGTGAAVAQMKHPLGGKTGTTSDFTDAWFLGFSPSVTCGVWVGYDSRESLGEKETGAKAALPIWMAVMKTAIAGKDDEQFLGDAENDPTRKAEATAPVKPGAKSPAPGTPLPAKANSASGNGAGAKPLKAALVVKGSAAPAATPVRATPQASTKVAKPTVQPAPAAAQPRVRPALPPAPGTPPAAPRVKQALSPNL